MLPWNNSWFQLCIFTAIFSAVVLGLDYTGQLSPSGRVPTAQTPSYSPTAPAYSPPAPVTTSPPETSAPAASTFPQDGTEWHNSLGMDFQPVETTHVLFCAWDTRVQDFRQFVEATGYDATAGVLSLDENGWRQAGHSWKDPGYDQDDSYPVVGVSWYDAKKFCDWLTQKERQAGVISANQFYRLPTDTEWNIAAGTTRYPWGDAWPPATTAGNYMRQGDGIPNRSTLQGTDGFAHASPGGTFPCNRNGLFDMGGNVWQWEEDWYKAEMSPEEIRRTVRSLDDDGGGEKYKAARGASYFDSFELALLTGAHDRPLPGLRQTNYGFRCVLVVSP